MIEKHPYLKNYNSGWTNHPNIEWGGNQAHLGQRFKLMFNPKHEYKHNKDFKPMHRSECRDRCEEIICGRNID